MIPAAHTLPARAALCGLLTLLATLALAGPASAGSYTVTACHGAENNSWQRNQSTHVAAYTACPGGVIEPGNPGVGAGMIARNVGGADAAPGFSNGSMVFNAPPGTKITRVQGEASMNMSNGWQAGLHDAEANRWLWCGPGCLSTFRQWAALDIGGLWTSSVQALTICGSSWCRKNSFDGYMALRKVTVTLADGSAPSLANGRGDLWNSSAWMRGVRDGGFDAADNAGVRQAAIETDPGTPAHRILADEDRLGRCDSSQLKPCPDGGVDVRNFNTAALADGEHTLRILARDAADNWSSLSRVIRVDNTGPARPGVTLDGGEGWKTTAQRTLRWSDPGPQAAPITTLHEHSCKAGVCRDFARPISPGQRSTDQATPWDGPGDYTVWLAFEDAAGNGGAYSDPVHLRYDPVRPGATDGDFPGGWIAGHEADSYRQPLRLGRGVVPPVSGIAGYAVSAGAEPGDPGDAITHPGAEVEAPLGDLPEGVTKVRARAISGAGLSSTQDVSGMVRVDRTPPRAALTGAPDPGEWQRQPVRVRITGADQDHLSGMAGAPDGIPIEQGAFVGYRLDGGPLQRFRGADATIEVAEDGRHRISHLAVDAAGNASGEASTAVKIDGTAPEVVAFQAADPADPRRIRVVVSDRVSGVAGGRIELRRSAGGDWTALETAFDGAALTADLDDEGRPDGTYELRAVVRDVAGNERVGDRRADGGKMELALPLRLRTRMTTNTRTIERVRCRVIKRSVRGAKGKPGGRRRVRICRTVRVPRRRAGKRFTVRVTPGRTRERTVHGLLETVDGRPLAGAVVGVTEQPRGSSATPRAVSTLRTDGEGRFAHRLADGPTRTLRFAYGGTRTLSRTASEVGVLTPARSTLRVDRRNVRNGRAVRFSGRLQGGHVTPGGKVLELQAFFQGRWQPFASVRTDGEGRWSQSRRFVATTGRQAYRFRVRIRPDAAYPFELGYSSTITVTVRGR